MKILVTYSSKTGFTKQYAEWIGEALACDVRPLKEVLRSTATIQTYDIIIHGGWLMAGMVSGLNKIKKLAPKQLIVFGVGFTEDDTYVKTIKELNQLKETPTFYFLGGTRPEKMNFVMKTVVKAATKQPVTAVDLSDESSIAALVSFVKSVETK